MNYDDWKTTDPADAQLGPEHDICEACGSCRCDDCRDCLCLEATAEDLTTAFAAVVRRAK